MKTLEQTVRRISVGLATLATTALLVMVTAATLFCGVTPARAQEPDNRIDWRWGRPGVMVVTNAPTAVTVTNIATEVAAEVASGVVDTMFGPRVTALEDALDGGTNNWNTAYSWGNHAGLYREIGWVPSWTEVTNKPLTFPPEAHRHDYTAITNAPWLTEYTETDEIALAALYGTNTILEAAITNEAALRTAHTEDTGNPHGVTAAQIGAITVEQDLAALRAYHYGSPDIVESPAEWFVLDGEGTITAFNWWAAVSDNVVIPWAIGGVPVTTIGANAFRESGIVSLIAPQTVTSIGDEAFNNCSSLTSIKLPQVTTIGDYAFSVCTSLTSIKLPQATSIGDGAFSDCSSLASIKLPQATSIGYRAFYYCLTLTAVHMGQNAPVQATDVFEDITPPPTVYVTNPNATGWGAVWNGAPVVRLDLYGDKIYQAGELVATTGHVAQAIAAIPEPDLSGKLDASGGTASNLTFAGTVTLNGDTITEWPAGGGETSIIAPLYESGTNVTVTSTQSVYSVAVTGAGPVGIDWSGLALDGTGRAEVTLRLNVTEWGGTNVTFSPSLTFDRTPEILVTGVWEFAASTIDGVTTRVRQTWPEPEEWATASYAYASGWVPSLQRISVDYTSTNSLMCVCPPAPLLLIRPFMSVNASKPASFSYGFSADRMPTTSVPTVLYGPFSVMHGYRVDATHAVENPSEYGLVQIWVGNSSPDSIATVLVFPGGTSIRPANANERAAYAAGWRP